MEIMSVLEADIIFNSLWGLRQKTPQIIPLIAMGIISIEIKSGHPKKINGRNPFKRWGEEEYVKIVPPI